MSATATGGNTTSEWSRSKKNMLELLALQTTLLSFFVCCDIASAWSQLALHLLYSCNATIESLPAFFRTMSDICSVLHCRLLIVSVCCFPAVITISCLHTSAISSFPKHMFAVQFLSLSLLLAALCHFSINPGHLCHHNGERDIKEGINTSSLQIQLEDMSLLPEASLPQEEQELQPDRYGHSL